MTVARYKDKPKAPKTYWEWVADGVINCVMPKPKPTTTNAPAYPSIASIPQTSPERLAQSFEVDPAPAKASTILYLAYGSNLAAETFLGRRGIRPVSKVNVTAPTLRMTFDQPGFPYFEPCFASTAIREIPKPPHPGPGNPPQLPPIPDPKHSPQWPHKDPHPSQHPEPETLTGKTWDKGLIGVVYEVTAQDYAKILATEGGGAGYQDIMIPCFDLPLKIPTPTDPELPKAFLAHTLFSPDLPDDNVPNRRWWWKLTAKTHRAPGYSQPSKRYLNLITSGAAQHELPNDYQAYLNSLQPYTVTTRRQAIGRMVFIFSFFFVFMSFPLASKLAGPDGRFPKWVATLLNIEINSTWFLYDYVFKPLFGDGERTIEHKQDVFITSQVPDLGVLGEKRKVEQGPLLV